MLKNYFKTAWRSLLKNKFYSIINIGGLSIGLAVGILMLLWAKDEMNFDNFHSKGKQIYKVENMAGTGVSRQLWNATASAIGVMAKKNIPGVQEFVRIAYNENYGLFKYKDKVFEEQRKIFADPSLFSVFDFQLIEGDKANPFADNHSIVITESTAKRYFGSESPIGKIITADDSISFKVTGLIKDFPKNSSISTDIVFPMNLFGQILYTGNKKGLSLDNDFIQYQYNTFLLLQPGTSLAALPDKLRQLHLSVKSDDTDVEYLLQSISDMHLHRSDGTDGGYSTVRMFIIIALVILLIACINYVNLSTARSMLRSKEVSLRKIVGAGRMQLFLQFVIETALLFVFAAILSVILMYMLMPVYNKISGKELALNFKDPSIISIFAITIIGTLFISGIYPALVLSSFQPAKALKGKVIAHISNASFRKILVVVQFSFSVVLIAGTIIVSNQLKYMRSMQLGYDKEHVLSVSMLKLNTHFETVKQDLLNVPGVSSVTWANANIVNFQGQTGDNSWDGKENGETMMASPIFTDEHFIPFFKIKMVEGQNFAGAVADSTHFILNESAVKAARLKDPIGKSFRMWNTTGTIIGVVKDFHFASMKQMIRPAVFCYGRPEKYARLYVKTTGKNLPQTIDAIEKEWKKYNAGYAFNYAFLNDAYTSLYKGEQQTGLLFNVFAGIAILISCLGLFGLAAFTAQVRTREIGVRKVLGANVTGIILLVSKDFIKLVFISIIISTPVAWWMMDKWLQNFAYRGSIDWWVFIVVAVIAILIALASVSVQSVRAAIANPIKSLRTE
ncbi:ABC transporter permease [Chitinophagaceae bacterium LWZ2-11]